MSSSSLLRAFGRCKNAAMLVRHLANSSTQTAKKRYNMPEFRPLYLDHQATTPLDPRVLDAMMPLMIGEYGNPHSRTHAYGWETEAAVEEARNNVAKLIGADPREIIFTSGATEANNMALKGVARFYKQKRNHIITLQTEHKCVLDSCRILESEGIKVCLHCFNAFQHNSRKLGSKFQYYIVMTHRIHRNCK